MPIVQIVNICLINMQLNLYIGYKNNSGKNMPEYVLRDNLD